MSSRDGQEKKQADKFTLEKFRSRLHRSAESAGEDLCGPAPPTTPHWHAKVRTQSAKSTGRKFNSMLYQSTFNIVFFCLFVFF